MDDATRRQIDAARPDFSTWLSANAGSGNGNDGASGSACAPLICRGDAMMGCEAHAMLGMGGPAAGITEAALKGGGGALVLPPQ